MAQRPSYCLRDFCGEAIARDYEAPAARRPVLTRASDAGHGHVLTCLFGGTGGGVFVLLLLVILGVAAAEAWGRSES